MNPFDFVKASAGDSILPFLIFVIWMVISVMGARAKKKKKEQQRIRRMEELARREQEPSPQSAPEKQAAPRKRAGVLFEEMRRELERVLAERRDRTETPAPEPAAQEQPAGEGMSLETMGTEEQSFEAASLEETAPEYAAPEPPPAEPVVVRAVPSAEAEEKPVEGGGPAAAIAIAFDSLDEARLGFLWSEILAPPKALREE
jgi:hypothetical protein